MTAHICVRVKDEIFHRQFQSMSFCEFRHKINGNYVKLTAHGCPEHAAEKLMYTHAE
jgi:hypothetical protein